MPDGSEGEKMKHTAGQKGLVIAAVLSLSFAPAAVRADVGKVLAEVAKQTRNSLAAVSFRLEGGPSRPTIGQAICIAKDENNIGTFMTFAVSPNIKMDRVKDMKLVVSGLEGKTVKAELLAVDPVTRIGFIRATEPYPWTPVRFSKAPLSIGEKVVSVGLMPAETGYAHYIGFGYVAAEVRVPEKLIRVTGGTLTNVGSPVFNENGLAVGVVQRQLPSAYFVNDGRQSGQITLRSQQETLYFLPVEEFARVLENPPRTSRQGRLAWVGVLNFDSPVSDPLMPGSDRPAVTVGRIVPGTPADKAGLKELDTIIALNGKPLERLATPELTRAAFMRRLMQMSAGQTVTFTILQGDKQQDVSMTLEPMPERPFEADQYINQKLAFGVRDKVMLDKYISPNPIPDVDGVLVTAAPRGGPAATAGLRTNDLITAVNQQSVKTVATFKQLL